MLGLNRDNSKLIDFICSEEGEKMMQAYSVSIHAETGDAFYNNFNTNESFYDFLLAQHKDISLMRLISFLLKIGLVMLSFSSSDLELRLHAIKT